MKCLYFVIFIIILQQLDGNVIGPQILGDATGLDSIWVVVSLLIFGNLFGVLGMVIAVPLFAVIYKIVTELVNFLLKKRELSTATQDYTAWNYPPRKDFQKWNPTSKRQKSGPSESTGDFLPSRNTRLPIALPQRLQKTTQIPMIPPDFFRSHRIFC